MAAVAPELVSSADAPAGEAETDRFLAPEPAVTLATPHDEPRCRPEQQQNAAPSGRRRLAAASGARASKGTAGGSRWKCMSGVLLLLTLLAFALVTRNDAESAEMETKVAKMKDAQQILREKLVHEQVRHLPCGVRAGWRGLATRAIRPVYAHRQPTNPPTYQPLSTRGLRTCATSSRSSWRRRSRRPKRHKRPETPR